MKKSSITMLESIGKPDWDLVDDALLVRLFYPAAFYRQTKQTESIAGTSAELPGGSIVAAFDPRKPA